jgi:hypothetical protein
MENSHKGHRKALLQKTIAKSIGTAILTLQNHWASGMSRLFNCLPRKIKIATLLLAGILLTAWNIALLGNTGLKAQPIPPVQTKSAPIPQTQPSDSLLLMEKIYESCKKPQR